MKAALCRRYGPPTSISIEEVPNPLPGPGEVLVAIEAAGLTAGDARIRGARAPRGMGPVIRLVFGLRGPRRPVLGREYAGRVVALGAGVTRYAAGDAVFGITDGMRMGAHAEQVAVRADGLILPRPDSLSVPEAAAFFFGGLTAADFLLDQCALQPGERVLVVGGTGAVGSAVIQIARHHGAHVTALAGAHNLDLARELGADVALDYRTDPAKGPFDVILDVPGLMPDAASRLAPGGRLGLVTADLATMLGAMLRPRRAGGRRLCASVIKETPQAMARLMAQHQAGAYRPLIGARFPLTDIAQAHAQADSGHKRGNLVIEVEPLP
ncbi:NAD(P)-dependent alcohol dehydrogenase [Pararhodobacter sp. SW119]|uniref:NAD(P)-dependent alcohol dehydrogenase n=1 Tax=Pararhodobacter sp. SW119 TaxID=2780075 RepID=UPI001ADEE6DE|nr:NAD(P)-dependent alcohol dehydrogenase [Pararhodobacter sp. SW119]